MGSNLLKTSKLRADEIVHYAYEFAHQYDREYGSPGYARSFLPKDEMRRILVDKALNSIPNCDRESANRVAISTEKILETMGITIKMAVSEESRQMNDPAAALDPQRDVGAGAGTGEQSPANAQAETVDEPDKAYSHPFGLGFGTEPESARYGADESEELPESEKYSHEEVDYESPSRHQGQSCSGCTMFVANKGACTGVVSPIKPGDWCHEFEAKKKGFTSALLRIQAAPKCPNCGSTDYGLMPSDFETAKCNKCGKNWDHGIVPGINDPSEKTASGEPPWWNEPSENAFIKGDMTKGEEIMDWLTRHQVPQEGGKYVLYHATPANGGATTSLRVGSYLAEDPETALHQAGRERGPKSGDLKVAKIYVNPWDIQTGVWATLRNEVPVVQWEPGVNPFKQAAKPGGGIHGDEAVNFYKPTTVLPPRYDQRKHIDENMVDDPIKDDLAADKKKMEGPTPATGHAPLRADLAQRSFMASEEDEYWLDMVHENEANAKKHFMESPDIQQIAQDNGWTMEQTWDEVGTNFCNEFYDPRNRLIAHVATLDANRPNAEAYNEFEASRAALNHLVTGEFTRNISEHLMSRLNGIYEDMELLSKDWDSAAGVPPEAHPFDEPTREEPRLPE